MRRGPGLTKAVLPAAGLGVRLLPVTKEMPKEMLPIYAKGVDGRLLLKPVLQMVFEQLHDFGVREFCFITGRGKRAIEDHFTPDPAFVEFLAKKGDTGAAKELVSFYSKIKDSRTVFANQHSPKGFGDAVNQARSFTDSQPFLVHAGDDAILSNNCSHLKRMVDAFHRFDASGVILAERADDPRKYGVIEGKELGRGVHEIERIEEKPRRPRTNLAVIGVYVFTPEIYRAIKKVKPDGRGETQLTDAAELLISKGRKFYAVELGAGERRLDIGNVDSYWKAINATYQG